MASKYKKMNLLKNLPFIVKKLKLFKKRTKNLVILNFYWNHHFSVKNLKN